MKLVAATARTTRGTFRALTANAVSIVEIVSRRPRSFMEMPVAPNSRINSICRVAVAATTVPFSCVVSRREIQFNNKNCSRALRNGARPNRERLREREKTNARRGKNRASERSKNTERTSASAFLSSSLCVSLYFSDSADRECTVCLYKQNTGISGNPIRQRRANYRESPFSDSRLFLGTILGGYSLLPASFPPALFLLN